ncbi:hypothetical protein QF001_004355 [Paraburkholderia youngii]
MTLYCRRMSVGVPSTTVIPLVTCGMKWTDGKKTVHLGENLMDAT